MTEFHQVLLSLCLMFRPHNFFLISTQTENCNVRSGEKETCTQREALIPKEAFIQRKPLYKGKHVAYDWKMLVSKLTLCSIIVHQWHICLVIVILLFTVDLIQFYYSVNWAIFTIKSDSLLLNMNADKGANFTGMYYELCINLHNIKRVI